MAKKRQDHKKWFDKGRVLMGDGKHSESITAFTAAIDENTEFGKAYFERAVCFYKLGFYMKAENDLKAAAVLGCEEALFFSPV